MASITNFSTVLSENISWIQTGLGDALGEMLSADNLSDGMVAFKKSLKQTVYDGMVQGLIQAAMQNAALQPLFVRLGDLMANVIGAGTAEGMATALGAVMTFMDDEFIPAMEKVATIIATVFQESGLQAWGSDLNEPTSNVTTSIINPDLGENFSDQIDEINRIVQKLIHSTSEYLEELTELETEWQKHQQVLIKSGHAAYDPKFMEQFYQAWDIARQQLNEKHLKPILERYNEIMNPMDDLQSAIHDINEEFDEYRQTLIDMGYGIHELTLLETARTEAIRQERVAMAESLNAPIASTSQEYADWIMQTVEGQNELFTAFNHVQAFSPATRLPGRHGYFQHSPGKHEPGGPGRSHSTDPGRIQRLFVHHARSVGPVGGHQGTGRGSA